MTSLNNGFSALAPLAAQATTKTNNNFGGKVTHVEHYPESTSVLVRVLSQDKKSLVKPLIVDIRMKRDKYDALSEASGLAKHAQVSFRGYAIAEHQPKTAENPRGDRFLPEKRDAQGNKIPGTKTPIHRILGFIPESLNVELSARPMNTATTEATNNVPETVASALSSATVLEVTIAKAEPLAPVEGAPAIPSVFRPGVTA